MSWLESLLNSCLFCPPKEDASEHPTPRQRRLFTSLRDKEWHELLIKLNESVTHPSPPSSSPKPTAFRETKQIRTYYLLPPEITWPEQPRCGITQRLMQRDEIIENGIQVIIYAHQILHNYKKDEEALRQLIVSLLKSHPIDNDHITDFCLYAWQHVIYFILKYQYDTRKINLTRIQEFYRVDQAKNTVDEKINDLKKMLAPEYTSNETLATIGQIAFDSELSDSIIEQLAELRKRLTLQEQSNQCPFTIAATAYQRIFQIYPFEKNGHKTGIALINYILTQYGYLPVEIKAIPETTLDKTDYVTLLTSPRTTTYNQAAYDFELACRENHPVKLAEHLKTMYILQNTACNHYKRIVADNIICAADAVKLIIEFKSKKSFLTAFLTGLQPFTPLIINTKNNTTGQTALHIACIVADGKHFPSAVHELLTSGADTTSPDHTGKTPLSYLKNTQHRREFEAKWQTATHHETTKSPFNNY